MKKTKIICTLGPATDNDQVLANSRVPASDNAGSAALVAVGQTLLYV
jgi:pyruvate kinase